MFADPESQQVWRDAECSWVWKLSLAVPLYLLWWRSFSASPWGIQHGSGQSCHHWSPVFHQKCGIASLVLLFRTISVFCWSQAGHVRSDQPQGSLCASSRHPHPCATVMHDGVALSRAPTLSVSFIWYVKCGCRCSQISVSCYQRCSVRWLCLESAGPWNATSRTRGTCFSLRGEHGLACQWSA